APGEPVPRRREVEGIVALVSPQDWTLPQAVIADATTWMPRSPSMAWFRIADATLELACDHPPLLEELDAIYGDLRIAGTPPGPADLRCTVARVAGWPWLALTFEASELPDLVDVASHPSRFRRRPDHVEIPGPLPGWRALMTFEAPDRFFIVAGRRQ